MAYRNFNLENLYVNKIKGQASLRTDDIEGARPQPRIRERTFGYNRDKSPEFIKNAHMVQQVPGYGSSRNPLAFSDAKLIEYRQNLHNSIVNPGYIEEHLNKNKGYNSRYDNPMADSQDQLQDHINPNKFGETKSSQNSVYSQRSSQKYAHQEPQEDSEAILIKKDYANFYGCDDGSTKDFIYKNIDSNAIKSAPIKKPASIGLPQKMTKEKEQQQFVREQVKVNPSFNHNKNLFFDGAGDKATTKDNKDQFINNYNEFYRGNTPTGNPRLDKVNQADIRRSYNMANKNRDVQRFDILSNQKNYTYSIDKNRLKNKDFGKHYENFANNPDFKKSAYVFYGVVDNIPAKLIDYKRKPATKVNELVTMSRAVGVPNVLNF